MPFFSHNDNRLHYRRQGEGSAETLLFIHGAAGMLYVWPPEVRGLEGYDCVAVDLLEHGKSKAKNGQSSIEANAALLREFIRSQLGEVTVVGHSMGGAVAQQLALLEPYHVRRLVLLCTSGDFEVLDVLTDPARAAKSRELIMKAAYHKKVDDAVMKGGEKMLQLVRDDVLASDFAECRSYNVYDNDRLKHIGSATLVLAGEKDRMTPPAMSEQLAATIPGADLQVIPDTGHMPYLEDTASFCLVLTDWLKKTSL